MALREKQTSTLNQDILSVQDKVPPEKSNEHILIVFNRDNEEKAAPTGTVPQYLQDPPRHTRSEMNSKLASPYSGPSKSQMPGNKRRDHMLEQSQFAKMQKTPTLQVDQLVASDVVSSRADESQKKSFKLQSEADRGTRANLSLLKAGTLEHPRIPTTMPPTAAAKDGRYVRMDTVFDVLVATEEDGKKSDATMGKKSDATVKKHGHEEPAVMSNRKAARKCDTLKHPELKAMLNINNNSCEPTVRKPTVRDCNNPNQDELHAASKTYSYVQTPTHATVNLNQTIDPKTLFNKNDKSRQGTQFKINKGQRSTKNKSVVFDPNYLLAQDKQDMEAKTLFLHNKTRLQTLKLNVLKDVEKFSSINPVNTSIFDKRQATRNCKTSQSHNRPRHMPMKIKHLNPLQVPVPLRYGNLGRIEEDAKKHIMIQELASKRYSGLSGALSTDRTKVVSRQQQRTKSQQLGFNNECETKSRSKQSVHILGERPLNVTTPPNEETDQQPQSISEEPHSAMVLGDMQQASPRFYEGDLQNKMSQLVSMDQRGPADHQQYQLAQDYIDKSYPSASSSFNDPNKLHRFKKIQYGSPPLQRPQARNCQTSQNPRIKNIDLNEVGNGLNGVNAREINLFQKHPKNVDGFDAPIIHQQNQRYKQLRKINNKDIIDDQESSQMGSYLQTSPMQLHSTLNEMDNIRQRKDNSLQKRRRDYLRNQEVMIIDFILKQYLRYRQKQSEYKNFKNSLENNNENQMQNMTQNFEYTYMMAYMKQRNIYSFSYFRKYNLDKFSNNPIASRIAKQVLSSLDPYRQMEHVKIDDFIALRKKLIEKSIIKKLPLPQQLESIRNNAFSQKDDIESELVRGGETGSNTIRNFGSSQSPKTRRAPALLSQHHINGRVSVISDRSRASGSNAPDNLMVTFSETQDARQHGAAYQDYGAVHSPNTQLRLVNKKSTLPQRPAQFPERNQSPKVKIVHRAAIFEQSIDVLNSNSFKPDMKQKKKLSMSITDTTEHQVGFKSILPDNLDYGIQDFEQYVALIIQTQSISEQIDKKATNISRSRKQRFGSDFRLDMTSLIDRKIFNSLKPQIHIPNLDLNKQIGRRVRIEKIEMQIKKLQLIKEPTAQNKLEIETLKAFLRTTAPDSRLLRSIEQPLRSNRPNQTTYRQSTLERDSHDFSIQERGSTMNGSQYEYSIYDVSQIRQSEESEKLEVKAVGLNINKHKNHNALKLRMLQQAPNSQHDIPVGNGLGETAGAAPQDFTNAYEQCTKLPKNIMNLEGISREDQELSNTIYRTTPKSGTLKGFNQSKKNNARLHAININQIQAAPSENFQRIDLETVRIRQKTQQMSNKSSASVPISHSSLAVRNQQSAEPFPGHHEDAAGTTPSVNQVKRFSTLKKRDDSQGGIHSTISEKGHDNRSDVSIKSSKYQNGKRSILIKSSVDQHLQGSLEHEQANSRDDATGDELDQENRMDSQMDTNQDLQQNTLDNQHTHTLDTLINQQKVEELMKKVSQGSSIQDIFPNGSIMYGEHDPYRDQRQISIEDDALDLRADLKVMMSLDGPNDYDENVDLLSSGKKQSRGHTRGGVRTSTKASIKLPARRITDDSNHLGPNVLLEQLSSCYGVMSPQAKKQQYNNGMRKLQSRQKKTRGKNQDLDQILLPHNKDRGRNSATAYSKEGSRGEGLSTQQSKSRNQALASKTVTPVMSHKYHIAPQYKIDKKATLTPVVANQPIKQGQIKHDYFKFRTLQQRATKPQRSPKKQSNEKEKDKDTKRKVEPLITSARHGRENGKNTSREKRSKSNTVTPRTTRDPREITTSNSHTRAQANAQHLGLKSQEVSIQNKFMADLRESIMYMQNMQITGNQLTSNHLESLNISMQENALSLHNSTVEQQEQLRKLQNQTVPIPSRSNSPMSRDKHDQLELENRMLLTHHLEEFNLLQMQQLQSPPASYIPPERAQFNLAQLGQGARNYQTPAYRNQVLQQGQIQSMIYKNRNNLCLQK